MKRRGFTLLELLIVLTILGILAVILFPVFNRSSASRRSICTANLKLIGVALSQYTQDFDERLPPVAFRPAENSGAPMVPPYGWADVIEPYSKSRPTFHCPNGDDERPRGDDPTRSGYTDYWMNTRAGGQTLKRFHSPATTMLCGEGNDGSDASTARYNRGILPSKWIESPDSPAQRHLGTGNYLFVDGHVKALRPSAFIDAERAGRDLFRP